MGVPLALPGYALWMMWLAVTATLVLASCGGDDRRGGDSGPAVDSGSLPTDAGVDSATLDAGPSDGSAADTGSLGPGCDQADSDGLFTSCAACDFTGLDCDTIDVSGTVRFACGCGSGCPCGLRCGSIEIAPGVSAGDICVR